MESKTHRDPKPLRIHGVHGIEGKLIPSFQLHWDGVPFALNWKPAVQVYSNPAIHYSLSWDMKRHKCPHHTHLNDTWMTPEWPLCLNNDYQRCLCWLLRMAAHTAVIQSWRTQTPSMYQTLFRGFFGNNKHLERKFWFKIDSEIWDISTANLYLRSTSEMFWLLHIQLNTIAYLHKRKNSQNKFSISLAVVRQSRDFQKHDSSHLIYYSTVKIHFQ